MSDTIDKRVVEMRFDNQQFESRTKTTLGTLEKLKNALNFSSASNGLDNLQKKANGFSLNPMAAGVEFVHVKFNALEVAALTALQNIVNRAVNAGVQIAKSLSVDQISAGFGEYELKMGSIQTIMASTGEDLSTVNAYLEELNRYADKTIYSFSDMTSNIGKFTNAGVKLEDAVKAIQGVSNVAAVSGANANEASRAMYNFAQALSAGYVKLIDWKSIENANMATVEFKDQLLQTALAMGTVVKEGDKYRSTTTDLNGKVSELFDATHMFNDSLSSQWMTTDVLVQALNNYSTDVREMSQAEKEAYEEKLRSIGYTDEQIQKIEELGQKAFDSAQDVKTFSQLMDTLKESVGSGWAQTFEIIFGDFEEAKRRWTIVNNEIGGILQRSADARNALLEKAFGIPDKYLDENSRNWDGLSAKIRLVGIDVNDFIEKCKDIGDEMGLIDKTAIQTFDDFKESLASGWLSGDLIAQAIASFVGPLGEANQTVDDASHSFERFKEIVQEASEGGWGDNTKQIELFAKAGWNAAAMQEAVAKYISHSELTMEDYQAALSGLTDEQLRAIGYDETQIQALRELKDGYAGVSGYIDDTKVYMGDAKSGADLLLESISHLWNALKGIFKGVKAGWDIAFPPMTAERLYNILDMFNSFTEQFDTWVGNSDASDESPFSRTIENIRDTFAGLGSILGIGWDVLKEVAKFLKDTFAGAIGDGANTVLEFTGEVGRTLVALRSWISENNYIAKGLAWLSEKISSAITGISEWLAKLEELPIVQKFIAKGTSVWQKFVAMIVENFPKAAEKAQALIDSIKVIWKSKDFSSAAQTIKDFASSLGEDLLGIWEKIKSTKLFGSISDGIAAIWNSIKELDPSTLFAWAKSAYESIKDFLQPVFDFFSGVKEKLAGYADSVNDGFTSIGDVLSNAGTYLREHVGNIIGALALFVGGAAIWKFTSTIIKIARLVLHPVQSIVDSFNNFASAAKGIKDAAHALAVVEVVGAIALLAYTATQIGQADLWTLTKGVAVIGILGLLVKGIISALASLNSAKASLDPKQIRSQAVGMLKVVELAGAVYLVAKAFQTVLEASEGKSWQQIVAVVVGLTIAVGALAALGWAISKYGGTGGKGVGEAMAAIGLDVYLVSKSFADILEAISAEGVTENEIKWATEIVIGMTAAVGLIAIALARISKLSDNSGGIGKIGGGIFAVALAVRVLASALNTITEIDFSKWDEGQTWTLIGIIGGLAAVMVALSKMPASAGLNGLGVLGVAAAVEILAIAIRTMASLDGGDIAKGVIAIGAMMVFIGIFTKMTQAGSQLTAKSAVVFVGLSAAILILSGAIALLSLLKTEDVIVGTIAIGALILCIGEMLKLSAGAKDLNILDYIGIVAIVAVIAAALVALSLLDSTKVAIGTVCIAALMGMMALLLKVGESAHEAMAPIAVITLAVAAIAGVLYLLANNTEPGRALEAAASIAMVFIAMGAVFVAAGALIEFIFTGIAAITALTLAITVLGGFLMLIGSIITDGALKNMDKAIEFAYKVGEFVGAIIGGFAAGVMKGIEDIGKSLTAFSENAKGFTDDMAEIGKNPKVINGIETLASAILKLTAADLINSISSFLGGGLDKMGKKFSASMISFADAVRSIIGKEGFGDISKSDLTKVSLATEAAESFVNFQNKLPKTGGVVQKLLGEPESLGSFALQMVAFASAVKITVGPEGFQDVTEEQLSKFDAVASAVSAFVDLQNDLPSSGGIVQKIIGEKEALDDFGEQLKNFAGAVKAAVGPDGFQDVTTDQLSKFDEICTAVDSFVTLQGELPETGGIVQRVIGEPMKLGDFGKQLVAFGEAIKDACGENAFGGIKGDQLETLKVVSGAATAFIALQNLLPTTGGIFQRILGKPTDIATFGDQIKAFAGSIRTAAGSEGFGTLKQEDLDKFGLVTAAVQKVIDVQAQLPDEDGWLQKIFGGNETDIAEFGKKLVSFAESVVNFCKKFTDNSVDATWLTTVTTDIQGLIDLGMDNPFANFGTFNDDLKNYGTAIWTFYCDLDGIDTTHMENVTTQLGALVSAAGDFSSTTAASFTDFSTALSGLSTTAIDDFRLNFLAGMASLCEAVATVLKVVLMVAESYETNFNEIGAAYTTELVSGMNGHTATVKAKIQMLTKAITASLKAAEPDYKERGSEAATKYLKEFQNQTNSAKMAAAAVVRDVVLGLSQSMSSIRQSGIEAASNYIQGISSYAYSAQSAGSSLSWNAISGLSQNVNAAWSYGSNFGSTFIAGMQGYMNAAYNAAYNIGRSAVNGLKRGIDAHSPSKESQESADNFGIGFVANLLAWLAKAGDAGKQLGSETVAGLNSAIAKIPDLLSEGMDFDPVIRPRVDLTSAQESVQTLNGMFNKSIGVAADVASVTGSAVNVSRVRTVSGDSTQGVEGEKQMSTQPLTIQNTFNITSNDPEEVANTVSRRIQRQVERKEATWAQLSGMRSPLVRSR